MSIPHLSVLLRSLILLMLLLGNLLSPASACLPPLDEQPASIAEKARDSTLVFEGVVKEITDTHVRVEVAQYFKGSGLRDVKITGFNGHSCTDYLVLDQRAVFFTTGTINGVLEAVYNSAFGSIREFNAETFAALSAINECMATYDNGWLEIPCIAVKESKQIYRALLEKVDSNERLKFSLSLAKPATKIQEKAFISSIHIPPANVRLGQLEVTINGYFIDGCGRLGPIYIHRAEREFIVALTQYRVDGMCTLAIEPFTKTISLETAGLSSGTYHITVNAITETFYLVP